MKYLFSFIGLISLLVAVKSIDTPPATGYKVGDIASDFKLKGTDGKTHSLSEIKDAKGYIVVFTCNHCPYSKMYEDRLIALHKSYAKKGYPVIAINPNDPTVVEEDSFDAMKERSKEKNFPFLYLFDDGQKVFPKYGATKTPHVFLLDKKRTVRYIGAIDDNAQNAKDVTKKYVELAIQSIVTNKKVDPNFTKAIGCGIKVAASN